MTSPVSKPLSIFIYSVEGLGHLNACIGLAQELVTHGHRVTFLTSETSKGQFEKFGFAEIVLHSSVRAECQAKGPPPSTDEKPVNPMKIFAQMLLQSGLLSSKSSLEKAQIVNMEVFDNMYHALIELNPQIEKLIEKEKPDAIIVDHFYIPPAIQQSTHAPWIMLWSGNPLALYGSSELPPFASGYATNGDRAEWREFDRVHRAHFINKIKQNQKRLNEAFNYEPIREYGEPYFNETSPYLNIYGYPQELDYHNEITIPERFVRVDAFCRDIPEPFQLPEGFADKHKLIYLSLGSMGGADVELMKRIISAISKTPHKCIVSKGPLHDEYELPSNCWGEAFLPQTRILPMVDLVITHGGNNTVTETFLNGKPMIVLPLFADQYDNAQRVHETGFGIRLATYEFSEKEMIEAIEKLLSDGALKERLERAKERIADSNSKQKACRRIELVVEQFGKAK